MIVFEFIFELIMEYLVCQLIRGLGLLGLKMITFSDLSFHFLSEKYKNSSKPYFMGFAILVIIIFLLIQVI